MPLLICTTRNGGCGFVDIEPKFKTINQGAEITLCPNCKKKDHIVELTKLNLDTATDEDNIEKAFELLFPNGLPYD